MCDTCICIAQKTLNFRERDGIKRSSRLPSMDKSAILKRSSSSSGLRGIKVKLYYEENKVVNFTEIRL